MANPKLTVATAHYDRTLALLEGKVQAEGFDLEVVFDDNSARDRHQFAKGTLEEGPYDAWETSFGRYCARRGAGEAILALPVFPRRLFPHALFLVNNHAGIRSPQDLTGKRVGLVFYQATASVLGRGLLRHQFGILPEQIGTWVAGSRDAVPVALPGVTIEYTPPGKGSTVLLEEGEVDALIWPNPPLSFLRGAKNIAPLFPDVRERPIQFYREYGFYPINHLIAIKPSLVARYPGAAMSLYHAFVKAQEMSFAYYDDSTWSHLVWGPFMLMEQEDALGEDAWAQGVARNRKNLDWFLQLEFEQGLTPRLLHVEDLFAEETLTT